MSNTTQWVIDPTHSSADFSVKHLGIAWVRGKFLELSGKAEFDPENLEGGSFEAEIQTGSITTFDEKRDGHLKSEDFFDVENHPTATFKSTGITKVGEGQYEVTGDLTIRGITKEVTWQTEFFGVSEMPVSETETQTRSAGKATTTINRHDFNISWDTPVAGGKTMVGGDVEIVLEVEFIKE